MLTNNIKQSSIPNQTLPKQIPTRPNVKIRIETTSDPIFHQSTRIMPAQSLDHWATNYNQTKWNCIQYQEQILTKSNANLKDGLTSRCCWLCGQSRGWGMEPRRKWISRVEGAGRSSPPPCSGWPACTPRCTPPQPGRQTCQVERR